MSDRKIRIRQMPDGLWAAGVDGWLDGVVATAQLCESTATALAYGAPLTATICVEATPWEASAAVCAVLGEDLPVEWETLPWIVLREAHGVVAGVTHILGASLEAKRAIDAVRRELAGVDGECVACGDEAPWDARESGWRLATCASGDPGWICPSCAAGDVDYEDGFPPPRWP